MLTIFTIPKPFIGHIGIIQRNAIRNWKSLHSDVQVILMGNENGVAEIARETDCVHLSEMAKSDHGTPMVDDSFRLADRHARHLLLAYVNCDILFFRFALDYLREIAKSRRKFLFTGHKWMVSLERELTIQEICSEEVLIGCAAQATMAGASGIDFFMYPRDQYQSMPPLIVGRPGWDNWMVYDTLRRQIPVIIPEERVMAIHQNHDTDHVPKKHPGSRWEGPEAEFNRRSIGSSKKLDFSLDDATHLISAQYQLKSREGDYRTNPRKLKALYPYTHWLRR